MDRGRRERLALPARKAEQQEIGDQRTAAIGGQVAPVGDFRHGALRKRFENQRRQREGQDEGAKRARAALLHDSGPDRAVAQGDEEENWRGDGKDVEHAGGMSIGERQDWQCKPARRMAAAEAVTQGSIAAPVKLTLGLAQELGPQPVTVDAVRPGLIETDPTRAAGSRKIIRLKWKAIAAGKQTARHGLSIHLLIFARITM